MRRLNKSLWPVAVRVQMLKFYADWYLIEAWLEKNLGRYQDKWELVARADNMEYRFKNQADAVFFSLRWL